MKTLYRIQKALYSDPWLILPSFHNSMVKQFVSHINGNVAAMPGMADDDENEYDDLIAANASLALVCVDGVIGKHLSSLDTMCGGVDCDAIADELKAARDNSAVKAIAMYFNTPGGTVTGVPELGELIAEISKIKPIYGYTDTLCASAGYWLASQCTAFACSESSQVGSVNVYMLLLDESEALDKEGIKVNAIVGSNGSMKLAGASFKPLTDDEREMFQEQINNIETQFISAVQSTRNIQTEYLNGACYSGQSAVQLGFADDNIPTLPDFLERLGKEMVQQ